LVLLRLWSLAVPLQFICGCYFILIGLGRFVEEHLRGEPQTVIVVGLRLYQWLAIAFVVSGAVITTLGASQAPQMKLFDPDILPITFFTGAIVYAASGIDLPKSNWRFSRLTYVSPSLWLTPYNSFLRTGQRKAAADEAERIEL